jgi:hypothetical protein
MRTMLTVLTVAVVTAPVWTLFLWGGQHRWLMIPLVAGVQLPLAGAALLPTIDPLLHLAAVFGALSLTWLALASVHLAAGPRTNRQAAATSVGNRLSAARTSGHSTAASPT